MASAEPPILISAETDRGTFASGYLPGFYCGQSTLCTRSVLFPAWRSTKSFHRVPPILGSKHPDHIYGIIWIHMKLRWLVASNLPGETLIRGKTPCPNDGDLAIRHFITDCGSFDPCFVTIMLGHSGQMLRRRGDLSQLTLDNNTPNISDLEIIPELSTGHRLPSDARSALFVFFFYWSLKALWMLVAICTPGTGFLKDCLVDSGTGLMEWKWTTNPGLDQAHLAPFSGLALLVFSRSLYLVSCLVWLSRHRSGRRWVED